MTSCAGVGVAKVLNARSAVLGMVAAFRAARSRWLNILGCSRLDAVQSGVGVICKAPHIHNLCGEHVAVLLCG